MQAKVSELEQQVDELAQRITLLSTEKANLDSRVNILVRVLRMRDEEVAQLQQKLKVTPPGPVAACFWVYIIVPHGLCCDLLIAQINAVI